MSTPDYKKFAVLYVDDEVQALKYFRRGLEKDFQILTASSVAEARTILEQNGATVGVVLSDQRMPGETGVQLLSEVRRRWPTVIRMLFTAYSDIDSAVDAVNSGSVFKYIHKPADFNLLRETIKDGLNIFHAKIEQESLVRHKMSALQRLIVEDRVRSLAALAGGISHHLRNAMTAMSCFLEEVPGVIPLTGPAAGEDAGHAYIRELWTLAQQERNRLLQIVKNVAEGVVIPQCDLSKSALLEPLVRQGWEASNTQSLAAGVVFEIPGDLPAMNMDGALMVTLFKTLLNFMMRLGAAPGGLKITVENNVPLWDTSAVRVRLTAVGATWSERDATAIFTPFAFPAGHPGDLGLEMLYALFIAYQHGGDIVVHRGSPGDPCFELLLPLNPRAVARPASSEDLVHEAYSGVTAQMVADKAA
jgi:two-component system probable response regulator PhcQ